MPDGATSADTRLQRHALWFGLTFIDGVIRIEGKMLHPPLFGTWEPLPPHNAKELARTVALLCRLLRDEVTEQAHGSESLTGLVTDWRKLLFSDKCEIRYGYA